MRNVTLALLAFIIVNVILLQFVRVSYCEDEVLTTYSLGLANQPMDDPDPPPEEIRETYYSTYIIPIVVAADEEFQSVSYWTPPNNYLSWKEAAQNMIERADNEIFQKYGIDFRIVGYTVWKSDDSLTLDFDRICELANKLNWNPSVSGKRILVGFTGQGMERGGMDVYGVAFNPKKNSTRAVLIHPEIYWADDNVVLHEISHILGIYYECYCDDCVMSAKETYITILNSDGWMFWVWSNVPYAMLSLHWCNTCAWEIFHGKYSIIREYENPMCERYFAGVGKGLWYESVFAR